MVYEFPDTWGVSKHTLDYLWSISKDLNSFRDISLKNGYTREEIESFLKEKISTHKETSDMIESIIEGMDCQ